MTATERPPLREAPAWDLVLKRNYMERLKRDKFPLDIREELPRLIEQGYEQASEEDIVRFQWWGLYHDKPKVGTFMLRVKIAGGVLSPPSCGPSGTSPPATARATGSSPPARTSSCTTWSCPTSRTSSPPWNRTASPPPGAAGTRCATSPPAPWPGSTPRSCSTPPPSPRRRPSTSTATGSTATSPASTRSPSPAAPTSATSPRCTASPSSAPSTRDRRATPCASAGASPPPPVSPATWRSSSPGTRPSGAC